MKLLTRRKRFRKISLRPFEIRAITICLLSVGICLNLFAYKEQEDVPCISYSFDDDLFMREISTASSDNLDEAMELVRKRAGSQMSMRMAHSFYSDHECIVQVQVNLDYTDLEMVCSQVTRNEEGAYKVVAAFQLAKDRIPKLLETDENKLILREKIEELARLYKSMLIR